MPAPREVSPDELATILGITARALNKLCEQGSMTRAARGKFDLARSVRDFVKHRERVISDRLSNKDESYAAGMKRRVWAQAAKIEMENQEREGQLVRTDLLGKHWSSLLVAFKSAIFAMPRKLASQLARLREPEECEALCRRELTQIMNRLASGSMGGCAPNDRRLAQARSRAVA